MDYFNLFFLSFLSSTLLPGGSEAFLIWLTHSTSHHLVILLLIATIGNTIGGFSNWLIGYIIRNNLFSKLKLKKNTEKKRFQIAKSWIKQWGYYVLLFSWLPIIGDLLCLAAGIYKLNAYRCIIYIFIGKCLRYSVVIFIAQGKLF